MNIVTLSNTTHADIKIKAGHGAEFGDDTQIVPVVPREIHRLAATYPIFLSKNPTNGEFYAIALLGFSKDENLFLSDGEWDARHRPLHIMRQPFQIARSVSPTGEEEAVVQIDMNSKRISNDEGEAVFLPEGGSTPFLENIRSMLVELVHGAEETRQFSASLEKLKLIDPVQLKIELADESRVNLEGLYGISNEALASLTGDQLAELHGHGWLELVILMKNSVSQVQTLIDRKNEMLKSS